MKVFPSVENSYISEQLGKQADGKGNRSGAVPEISDWLNADLQVPGGEEDNGAQRRRFSAISTILTPGEMTTLHMLFGTGKPEEFTFYNTGGMAPAGGSSNRVNQIHKGHLLDVTG